MDPARGLADHLLANAVPDLTDEDGRPVGEVGSARYAAIGTDTSPCPYADARRGGTMNRSALRQMASAWPALLGTFRALRGPTVHDAFRVALIGTSAPALAHALAPDRPIPRALSALYKTSLGLSQVLAALLLAEDGVADAPAAELGDGAAFFRFLDDGRWLIGQEQVCAGTEAMIVAAWDALVGEGHGELAPELAALGDPEGWVGVPLALVGAVAVAGIAVGGDPAGLEAWIGPRGFPWTRALFAVAGRGPDHALRLFPAGRAPAAVVELLGRGPARGAAWAERVREAVAGALPSN